MSFESPLALVALVAVPLLAALYVVHERGRARAAARFARPELLSAVVDRSPGRHRHVPVVILLVALAAMIVGVARPHAVVSVPREEATVLLAIDVSRSMSATDVRPTRLGAAQEAARAFLETVPERYRVGIVAFGSLAAVALPPTEDRELAAEALATLRTGEGTALGDAILLAAELGQKERAADGTVPPTSVLLISDGAPDGGETEVTDATKRAKELGIPVSTVVVGTQDGVLEVPLEGGYRQLIRVPPDPDTLRAIAAATGGRFYTATEAEGLREVYESLGSRLGERRQEREVTDAFAGGSAALLLVGGALSVFWLRRLP